MIFDGKPTDEITVEELRQLVADHVAEDRHLDYKQAAYPQNDYGTGELTKDVTAFLNADGGYLIIGIREDGQRRAEALVPIEDAEGARRSIIDRCLVHIKPRPPILDIRPFDVDDSTILVIRVPESDRKPHCALPDAEHHYFWRRYEDGNKLMSPAEIRECFQGDRVYRALAALRREAANARRDRIAAHEASLPIDEANLLTLQTDDIFLQHAEQLFLSSIGVRPYYRLWATPIPVNQIDLHGQYAALIQLLRDPPKLRQEGWDLSPGDDFRQTPTGIIGTRPDFHHLQLLWNGHVEFWTAADGLAFLWDEVDRQRTDHHFLYPFAIIEPAACFTLLVQRLCEIAQYEGELRFGLGLYNIRGRFLAPNGPDTFSYGIARSYVGQLGGAEPFQDEHLPVAAVSIAVPDLPDELAWNLAKQVYYRFGYTDDQIPLFDASHQCTLGRNA